MATYVAFLRAINLGAQRRFGKDDVARVTAAAGFTDVATHLNTGNVRVGTRLRSPERVREVLEAAYAADRGFAVPVAVVTPEELRRVREDALEVRATMPPGWDGRGYVSFLRDDPDPDGVVALEAMSTAEEAAHVRGRAVHLLVRGYGTSRMTNVAVERHLGVATARADTVVEHLVRTWC